MLFWDLLSLIIGHVKSKSFLDKIIYKSISEKKTFKNFNIKCFLPEKGSLQAKLKLLSTQQKLYSCSYAWYLMGATDMMHVGLWGGGIFCTGKDKILRFLIKKFTVQSNPRFGIWVPYFVASGKEKLPHQATVCWLGNIVKGENYYQKK